MYADEIALCCKELRLSKNIAEKSTVIKAKSNQEYLLKLLQEELKHREEAKRERLLSCAGFYSIKTFDGFVFDEIEIPGAISPDYLKNCGFFETKSNIVMYGNPGTGKTHLSIAIGVEACRMGKKVKFCRTSSLVNTLTEAKRNGNLSKVMKDIGKADLLICDEWGYVPLDRTGSQLLFEIISQSYEQKPVIINTNIEFSRWVNVFYDEQMTGALIDRLLHHCHLLLFQGGSMRMKKSTIRQ